MTEFILTCLPRTAMFFYSSCLNAINNIMQNGRDDIERFIEDHERETDIPNSLNYEKMIRLLTIAGLLLCFQAWCQHADTLTLDSCRSSAAEHYPLTKQRGLIDASLDLRQKNLNATYYPQLILNGQATYQSAVTTVEINIPDNPYFSGENIAPKPISKDQYKLTLDINQVIYDGGNIPRQKDLERMNHDVDRQNVEVDIYKLKQRVDDIFFNIVFLQENRKIVLSSREELEAKLGQVESAVRNGVMLSSEADVLHAEMIRLDQQLIDIGSNIEVGLNILSQLTGLPVTGATGLILPEVSLDPAVYVDERPEYILLGLQQERVEATRNLLPVKIRPRLNGFGQAGYGRPGLNMLSNKFDPFYIVGARLSWNIWDWNQTSNSKQLLGIQHDIINTQKEAFEQNLSVQLEAYRSDIMKYEQMIKQDNDIIQLRGKIMKSAGSQLDNGVITAADYIGYLHDETRSRIDRELHRISLVKAKVNYLTAQGKF